MSYDDLMTELIEKLINLFVLISLLLKTNFFSPEKMLELCSASSRDFVKSEGLVVIKFPLRFVNNLKNLLYWCEGILDKLWLKCCIFKIFIGITANLGTCFHFYHFWWLEIRISVSFYHQLNLWTSRPLCIQVEIAVGRSPFYLIVCRLYVL